MRKWLVEYRMIVEGTGVLGQERGQTMALIGEMAEEMGREKTLVGKLTEENGFLRGQLTEAGMQVGRMAETVDQHNHLSILLVETCQKIIQGPNLILEELQDTNRHLKAISATLEESRIANSNDNR